MNVHTRVTAASKTKATPKKAKSKSKPKAKAAPKPPEQAEIPIPPQPAPVLDIQFAGHSGEFIWDERDNECPLPQFWRLEFPSSAGSIAAKVLVAREEENWYGGYDVDDPIGGGLVVLPSRKGLAFASHLAAALYALSGLRKKLEETPTGKWKKEKTVSFYPPAIARIDEYAALIGQTQSMERAFYDASQPTPAAAPTPELARMVPIASIDPWKDQPRRKFDKEGLEELTGSMRIHGFIPAFPLLVRPVGDRLQLVAGERRWRAAQVVEIREVPCVIREMTDGEARELSLLENLQRVDLSPIEEAEGYQGLLDLRDGEGKPVHTVNSIAERIGKTARHVSFRLSLLVLRGSNAAEALESGELPYTQARLIARIPSAKLRDELTHTVLHNPSGSSPMPEKELSTLIRETYQRELKGAPFDQADASLVPVQCDAAGVRIMGGACTDCPHNSKNAVGEVEQRDTSRGKVKHLCGNTECYAAKNVARYERWRTSVADTEKKISALPFEENAALWNPYTPTQLNWNCEYVELSDPAYATGLTVRGDTQTWADVVKGTVPVILAEDPQGKIHEIAAKALAIEAAKVASPDYFVNPRSHQGDEDEDEEEEREEINWKRKHKKEQRIAELQERKFIEAILAAKQLQPEIWDIFALVLIRGYEDQCGGDDLDPVAKGLGWTDPSELESAPEDAPDANDFLLARIREVPERQKVALFTQILFRTCATNYREEERNNTFAAALGVDISKIPEEAENEILEEEKRETDLSEIAKGLKWDHEHDQVEDFNWNEQNACENPDKCTVEFPGLKKSSFLVEVGRAKKGWHVGWNFNLKSGSSLRAAAACDGTAYDSRTLALKIGLLHLQEWFEDEGIIDQAIIDRLEAYLEALEGGVA